MPLPQLDGLQEECAGGSGSVLRSQDAEQREVYREGCILDGEKGTMREPREPRLGMDSPIPRNLPLPHPPPSSQLAAAEKHTEAQPAVVELPASSFIQQPPSVPPPPGSPPRLLCEEMG